MGSWKTVDRGVWCIPSRRVCQEEVERSRVTIEMIQEEAECRRRRHRLRLEVMSGIAAAAAAVDCHSRRAASPAPSDRPDPGASWVTVVVAAIAIAVVAERSFRLHSSPAAAAAAMALAVAAVVVVFGHSPRNSRSSGCRSGSHRSHSSTSRPVSRASDRLSTGSPQARLRLLQSPVALVGVVEREDDADDVVAVVDGRRHSMPCVV